MCSWNKSLHYKILPLKFRQNVVLLVFDKVIFTIGGGAWYITWDRFGTIDTAVHITLGNTVEPDSTPPEPRPPLNHRPPKYLDTTVPPAPTTVFYGLPLGACRLKLWNCRDPRYALVFRRPVCVAHQNWFATLDGIAF